MIDDSAPPRSPPVDGPWIASGEIEGREDQLLGNAAGLERLAVAIQEALAKGEAEIGLPESRLISVARIDQPRDAMKAKRASLADWLGGALSLLLVSALLVAGCLVLLRLWHWMLDHLF
jgi:hypothetical protein